VRAPFRFIVEFDGEPEALDGGDGEDERGDERELGRGDPLVAHMDGDEGGSGERVK
jgi:hypothetical protein